MPCVRTISRKVVIEHDDQCHNVNQHLEAGWRVAQMTAVSCPGSVNQFRYIFVLERG